MVRYSVRAIRALGYLKQRYNSIEIYVEDTTCHNMHLLVFRALLGKNARLTSVNQVGDKNAVIAACRQDQATDGRKRIYVLDGDFNPLLGKRGPRLKYLYTLDAYDIENLIIHEGAIIKIGMLSRSNDTENKIAQDFDFQNWLHEAIIAFKPLFVVYAAAHHLIPSVPTVSYPVQSLCEDSCSGISPNPLKIRKRTCAILKEIFSRGKRQDYLAVRRAIKQRFSALDNKNARLLSGKRLFMPLLLLRMRRLLGYHGDENRLRVHLASHFEPSIDRNFARRLKRACA